MKDRWQKYGGKRYLQAQVELLAAVTALQTFGPKLQNRSVVVFEDSKTVHANLIRGFARSELSSELVFSYWFLSAWYNVVSWIERVHTGSNIADAPSRFRLALIQQLGCVIVPAEFPEWLLKGHEALVGQIEKQAETEVIDDEPEVLMCFPLTPW